jgi:hypothetical protein
VQEWPIAFLRAFGQEKNIFSFEAGRRCGAGEGMYSFEVLVRNLVFCFPFAATLEKKKKQFTGLTAPWTYVPQSVHRQERTSIAL